MDAEGIEKEMVMDALKTLLLQAYMPRASSYSASQPYKQTINQPTNQQMPMSYYSNISSM
jgi:hypothetical protein